MIKKLPSVLIITGLHGNEQYSDIMIKAFREHYEINGSISKLEVFGMVNEQNSREAFFNLNRINDVNNLFNVAHKMKKLLAKIKEYDIILDSHNSPLCINLLLCSSKIKRQFLVPEDTKLISVWRKAETDSISEYARKLGKISFTLETNGMYLDGQDISDDITFVKDSIELCLDIYHRRGNTTLFTPENELKTIVLKNRVLLKKNWIYKDLQIESINGIEQTLINDMNNGLVKYEIHTICIDGNYTNNFEGTLTIL